MNELFGFGIFKEFSQNFAANSTIIPIVFHFLKTLKVQKYLNHVLLVKSSFLAKIGFDTAENEPPKAWRRFNSFFRFAP